MLVPINWKPSRDELRGFSEAGMFFLGMVAAPVSWLRERYVLAGVLWSVAVLIRVCGFVRPEWLRPVFVGLTVATYPIGWVVSHTAIALLYYGMMTPIGIVFRLIGRDPLQRQFDRNLTTYWSPRELRRPGEQYFRQW